LGGRGRGLDKTSLHQGQVAVTGRNETGNALLAFGHHRGVWSRQEHLLSQLEIFYMAFLEFLYAFVYIVVLTITAYFSLIYVFHLVGVVSDAIAPDTHAYTPFVTQRVSVTHVPEDQGFHLV
jgi:hypothetical protein